jgi:hypothetical protein
MDTITAPSGVKRYRPKARDKRFAVLSLSWWFTDGPLLTREGLDAFLGLIEKTLPEALPKRYGLYEPPQHQYAEMGTDHLLGFLDDHREELIVWYPHRPVVAVSLSCSPKWGTRRQGFWANYVQIKIEANVLEQPGWDVALARFWQAASHTIQPFYGDVRTLQGFLRMGATYGSDMDTDFHPVKGPWWIGIPRSVGHALVLGEPYLSCWTAFRSSTAIERDLGFLSTGDWRTGEEVSDMVGGVPDALAQRWVPEWVESEYGGMSINWNTEFPPEWPF